MNPSKLTDLDVGGLGNNFSFKYSNGNWTVSADNHVASSVDLQEAIKTVVRRRRELDGVQLADCIIGTELRTGLVGEYRFAVRTIKIVGDTVWVVANTERTDDRLIGTFTPGDWLVISNFRYYIIPRCLLGK